MGIATLTIETPIALGVNEQRLASEIVKDLQALPLDAMIRSYRTSVEGPNGVTFERDGFRINIRTEG